MEFRKVLCNELSALMKENDKIVILDADLAKPDGIYPLFVEYPNRCFQVGIAEANMAFLWFPSWWRCPLIWAGTR